MKHDNSDLKILLSEKNKIDQKSLFQNIKVFNSLKKFITKSNIVNYLEINITVIFFVFCALEELRKRRFQVMSHKR